MLLSYNAVERVIYSQHPWRVPGFSYVYMPGFEIQPGAHYVSVTDSLKVRLSDHNAGRVSHTSKLRPWRIKTAIAFAGRARAAGFERYSKSSSGRAFAKKHL